jgi:hypothetical protein
LIDKVTSVLSPQKFLAGTAQKAVQVRKKNFNTYQTQVHKKINLKFFFSLVQLFVQYLPGIFALTAQMLIISCGQSYHPNFYVMNLAFKIFCL